MAKTKKFKSAFDVTITPKSKDTVYVYNGDKSAHYAVSKFNVDLTGYTGLDYDIKYYKKGYDLVFKTMIYYTSTEVPKKVITTTVKDYFKNHILGGFFTGELNQDLTPGTNYLYANVSDTTEEDYILASSNKNAKLSLSLGGEDFIYDEKGNDKYNFTYAYKSLHDQHGKYDTVFDISGNDEYRVSERGEAVIRDYSGKDYYYANGNTYYSEINTHDYNGNDKYTAENGGFLIVYDYAGSDKYYFKSDEASTIEDYSGKDKYYIYNASMYWTDSTNVLKDYAGNDYYEVNNSKGLKIEDSKGKDKYKVTNCTGLSTSDSKTDIMIRDYGKSKDTYIFNNVEYASIDDDFYRIFDYGGNDKYTLTKVQNMDISDNGGNDKYTVKTGTDNFTINDNSGKDKYSFIGSSFSDGNLVADVYVYDHGGQNDKYTFKNVSNFLISGGNYRTVIDEGGDDTYNVENSLYVVLEDVWGNDKYNFSATAFGTNAGSEYTVYDNDGSDKYTLKGKYNRKTKTTKYLSNVSITDKGADKDTYNLQYVSNSIIKDDGGKNTYNLKNTKSVTINTSSDLSDKYNLTNSIDFVISDSGTTTKDKYNLKTSSCGIITDQGGDDEYIIDKLKNRKVGDIQINDKGTYSRNDKLTIANLNKKDIVFMTNYNTANLISNDENCSLIIYDKKNKGFVTLNNFYNDSDNDGIYYDESDSYGVGRIETIKAGKNTVKAPSADYFTNNLKFEVSEWLDDSPFYDVRTALTNGTDNQVMELVNIFENFKYNKMPR